MPRFKAKSVEVLAIQVGADGTVEVDGSVLYGNAGMWLVFDPKTNLRTSTWTDPEFRARFEPADDAARLYLSLLKK